MKNLIPSVCFLMLMSCKRDHTERLAYPECLKTKIQEILANPPHTQRSNIKKFTLNGEYLYSIEMNTPIADEQTGVVNERCETVCVLGGIGANLEPNCLENATFVETV